MPTEASLFETIFPTWHDSVYGAEVAQTGAEDEPELLLAELITLFTEWMTAFKVTDACAKAAYTMLQTLLPPDSNSGNWASLKKLLVAVTSKLVTYT